MLFLVIAWDGTDEEAPARRLRVRETHLDGARARAATGVLQIGGALLNADGGMIGSALIVEAEDEAGLRVLLEGDVYHREGVWRSYEIHPFRRAV
jgi:uncharacterized protein